MEYAKVQISSTLELEIVSAKTGVTATVALTRIGAQILIDALSEYVGLRAKSATRGRNTAFSAEDVSPTPLLGTIESRLPAKKSYPIRLAAPIGGCVRLDRKGK